MIARYHSSSPQHYVTYVTFAYVHEVCFNASTCKKRSIFRFPESGIQDDYHPCVITMQWKGTEGKEKWLSFGDHHMLSAEPDIFFFEQSTSFFEQPTGLDRIAFSFL